MENYNTGMRRTKNVGILFGRSTEADIEVRSDNVFIEWFITLFNELITTTNHIPECKFPSHIGTEIKSIRWVTISLTGEGSGWLIKPVCFVNYQLMICLQPLILSIPTSISWLTTAILIQLRSYSMRNIFNKISSTIRKLELFL